MPLQAGQEWELFCESTDNNNHCRSKEKINHNTLIVLLRHFYTVKIAFCFYSLSQQQLLMLVWRILSHESSLLIRVLLTSYGGHFKNYPMSRINSFFFACSMPWIKWCQLALSQPKPSSSNPYHLLHTSVCVLPLKMWHFADECFRWTRSTVLKSTFKVDKTPTSVGCAYNTTFSCKMPQTFQIPWDSHFSVPERSLGPH